MLLMILDSQYFLVKDLHLSSSRISPCLSGFSHSIVLLKYILVVIVNSSISNSRCGEQGNVVKTPDVLSEKIQTNIKHKDGMLNASCRKIQYACSLSSSPYLERPSPFTRFLLPRHWIPSKLSGCFSYKPLQIYP